MEFSDKDAEDIVTIAKRAPLQNMDEAQAVNDLLGRFLEFYESTKEQDDGI
jgi:hypothetical protein